FLPGIEAECAGKIQFVGEGRNKRCVVGRLFAFADGFALTVPESGEGKRSSERRPSHGISPMWPNGYPRAQARSNPSGHFTPANITRQVQSDPMQGVKGRSLKSPHPSPQRGEGRRIGQPHRAPVRDTEGDGGRGANELTLTGWGPRQQSHIMRSEKCPS